jgi:hypothetical protein
MPPLSHGVARAGRRRKKRGPHVPGIAPETGTGRERRRRPARNPSASGGAAPAHCPRRESRPNTKRIRLRLRAAVIPGLVQPGSRFGLLPKQNPLSSAPTFLA